MKTYEKVLLGLNILLTVIYSVLILSKDGFNGDGAGALFGALLVAFLIPYLIAYILSKFSKTDNKKHALWKLFLKVYPIFLIIVIIGALPK